MNNAEAKLVAALRSGKYKQGQGCLQSGDRHCCLGVACAVYQEEVGDLVVGVSSHSYIPDKPLIGYDGKMFVLPYKVQEWLGWSDDCGQLPDDWSLPELNDSGITFEQIADRIEAGEVMKSCA